MTLAGRLAGRWVVAVAVVPLLLVAGCGGDSPQPKMASSPSTTPTPTPRATPSPAAWEVKSNAGAVAFAKHWIAVFNEATRTGDTSELKKLGTAKCETCTNFANVLDELYGSGGEFEGNGWKVRQAVATRDLPHSQGVVALRIHQPAEAFHRPGKQVERHEPGTVTYSAELLWRGGGWTMNHLYFES